MTLQEKIADKIAASKLHLEQLPGAIIIHQLPVYRIVYMSPYAQKMLGVTMQALNEMSIEDRKRFISEEEMRDYEPKVKAMLERNDMEERVSYFQQVRSSAEVDWRWVLCSMRIFMRDDEGKPLLTLTTVIYIDPQYKLPQQVNLQMEGKRSRNKNEKLFASLTPREKEIVRLIAAGKNGADIAAACYLSIDTVKTHRRNIKRKLNVESTYDIVHLVHTLGLS